MRNDIHPVRKTPEGLVVLAGTFPMVDTYGIPLEIMLEVLLTRGCVPDWIDFYESAISVGWKASSTVVKISEAVADIFGGDYREAFDVRFQEYLHLRDSGSSQTV